MRAPRSLGNLRGSLPNSLHRSHFPTTGLALARTDRRSHHRRRHPRPFGPQCPSHRDARRVHAKKPQPTQGSKPAMIPIFYIRKQGQRGCCPLPLHPKSPPNLTFASLRTIRSCLTIPNTYSTITMPASLRSDCCSPSLRNAVRLPSGIDVHLHRNTQFCSFSDFSSLSLFSENFFHQERVETTIWSWVDLQHLPVCAFRVSSMHCLFYLPRMDSA